MRELIYFADDEKNIRELIDAFLTQEGFIVKTFTSGDELVKAYQECVPDLVILDICMPGTDGLSICSQLRKRDKELPIIILSARDSAYDRVTGLTLGSDDYLVKPFLPLELVARVRALLRRSKRASFTDQQEHEVKKISFGAIELFPERRNALLNGDEIMLTPTEFDFMAYLIQHKERAVSRDELLDALWQVNWHADTRATDDLVKRLRRKLREKKSDVRIETVWGYGFRISKDGEVQ